MTVNPNATPRTGGLRAELLLHFKANPHDVLTIEAAAEKFDVSWVDVFNTRNYMQRMHELARGKELRLTR